MTTDTDPTPPHGTPRPTKTHTLDRILTELKAQRLEVLGQMRSAGRAFDRSFDQLRVLNKDIDTIEQLLIDMFPEPRD